MLNIRLQKDFALFKKYIRDTYETDDATLLPDLADEKTFDESFLNPREFTILMCGPKNSPYEGGTFRFQVIIPNEYPMVPPKVICKTKIVHKNISENYVCVETLQDGWSPSLGLKQLFMSIYAVMFTQNYHQTVKTITQEDLEKHEQYTKKATEATKIYAKKVDNVST